MKGKHAKNTANKQKLAKRMLALCFAVVFLCSCVLPVFATGSSLLTDALREAVEETAASTDTSTEAGGGTMMDDFQSMVSSSEYKTTYRFWLSEKDSYDLPDAAKTSASDLEGYADFYAVAAIVNNTTLTAPEGFQNPTDPTGAGRKFEGWYYYNEYGTKDDFTFDDSSVLLDKSATIDVFAQWGEAPAADPADDADKAEGDTKADDTKAGDTKADDTKAGDTKADDTKADDTTTDDETASDEKTTPSEESSKNTETKNDETRPAPPKAPELTADDAVLDDDRSLMASMYDDMVALAAATSDYTVKAGESTTITGTKGYEGYDYHSWISNSTSVATVSKQTSGYKATVKGVNAGTTTITHGYYKWNSKKYQYDWTTETITVTVTGEVTLEDEAATVYILLTPTSDRDSNATSQWGYGIPGAKINMTGATWDGQNVKQNVSGYILNWPQNMPSVTIKNGNDYVQAWDMPLSTIGYSYADDHGNQTTETMLDQIWRKWSEEIKKDIGDNDLTSGDIEHIYIIPYKISKDNGTSGQANTAGFITSKHIDCEIRVVCSKVFLAKFHVEDAGATEYTQISAKNYKITNNVRDNVQENNGEDYKTNYPANKMVGNVRYVFDGWYNEAGEKVTDWSNYTPTDAELEGDNTVNFYAKYIPQDTVQEDQPYITVEKQVVGLAYADLPSNFGILVDGNPYPLERAEKIVANDGSFKLRWKINTDAGNHKVGEQNYTVDGYDVVAKVGESEITAANPTTTVNVQAKTFTVNSGAVTTTNSEQTFNFGVVDNTNYIFAVSINGNNRRNIIVSKEPLSVSQRASVVEELKKLNDSGSNFSQNAYNGDNEFYSLNNQTEIIIAEGRITYSPAANTVTISAKSVWNKVVSLNYDVTKGNNPEVTITNSYTSNRADLTVTKTVTGNMADLGEEFTFRMTITDADIDSAKITYKKGTQENGNLNGLTPSNGGYEFKLKNNESIVFSGIPAGANVTVTETGAEDYKTTVVVNDTPTAEAVALAAETGSVNNKTGSVTISADAKTIAFTNTKEIPVNTGVILDTLPYVLMLIAVGGGVVAFFLRRRHHDDEE